jgi:hypothetical protein
MTTSYRVHVQHLNRALAFKENVGSDLSDLFLTTCRALRLSPLSAAVAYVQCLSTVYARGESRAAVGRFTANDADYEIRIVILGELPAKSTRRILIKGQLPLDQLEMVSEVFTLGGTEVRRLDEWEIAEHGHFPPGWRGACKHYAEQHGRSVAVRPDGSITMFTRGAEGDIYQRKRVFAAVVDGKDAAV